MLGSAGAVLSLYVDAEAGRFWNYVGVWLALLGTTSNLWIGRIRERAAAAPRRLSPEQKRELTNFLSSDLFAHFKVVLRVGTVDDAEAQMFAWELQNLFKAGGINIYPTWAGAPNECFQLAPSETGLTLTVPDIERPHPAFALLQRKLHAIGFPTAVQLEATRATNEAMLVVLKKPV